MDPSPSPLAHLEAAFGHLRGLIASELQLARVEMTRNLKAARTGLVLAAIGLFAALAAIFSLTAALFLALAALGLDPALAALLTGAGLLVVAGLCLWIGLSRLSPRAIAPTRTTAHAAQTLRQLRETTHA